MSRIHSKGEIYKLQVMQYTVLTTLTDDNEGATYNGRNAQCESRFMNKFVLNMGLFVYRFADM